MSRRRNACLNEYGFLIGLLFSMVLLAAGASRAEAGNDGQRVWLGSSTIQLSGPGMSRDSFLNSLTDVNGLLESFTPGSSRDVRIRSTQVEGNDLTIHASFYKFFFWHKRDISGKLRFARTGCASPAFGGTYSFTVDGPVLVRSVQFLVCATSNPDHSLHVKISRSLVAGPQYMDSIGQIINEIFSPADVALANHTKDYVAGGAAYAAGQGKGRAVAMGLY